LRDKRINGQLIKTLADGHQTADWKTVSWNGRDKNNRRVSSGVYFYRMTAPGFIEMKKMVLLQ